MCDVKIHKNKKLNANFRSTIELHQAYDFFGAESFYHYLNNFDVQPM